MKMENIVTGFKLSTKLKEVGFPQEDIIHSHFHVIQKSISGNILLDFVEIAKNEEEIRQGFTREIRESIFIEKLCTSPTTDELLDKLPARLKMKGTDYTAAHLSYTKFQKSKDAVLHCYCYDFWNHNKLEWDILHCEREITPQKSLAKLYIWLKKEGLI